MGILAAEAVGEFVGQRLADHVSPGVQQPSHGWRSGFRWRMRVQPGWAAEPRPAAGDIKDILGRKCETGQGPVPEPFSAA